MRNADHSGLSAADQPIVWRLGCALIALGAASCDTCVMYADFMFPVEVRGVAIMEESGQPLSGASVGLRLIEQGDAVIDIPVAVDASERGIMTGDDGSFSFSSRMGSSCLTIWGVWRDSFPFRRLDAIEVVIKRGTCQTSYMVDLLPSVPIQAAELIELPDPIMVPPCEGDGEERMP